MTQSRFVVSIHRSDLHLERMIVIELVRQNLGRTPVVAERDLPRETLLHLNYYETMGTQC